MRASLDTGDGRVDLEHISDRHTSLWAEIVALQTEKGGGNKNGMIGMLLPNTVTKKKNLKEVVTRGMTAYTILVIVVLILSASAIAMPPLGPSSLPHKLKKEGVTRLE